MQATTMNFTIEPITHDSVVIRVGKALDFRNAADFKAVAQEQVRSGIRNFIPDFTETRILDSTGLRSIFSLYRQVSPISNQVICIGLASGSSNSTIDQNL
jgi:anti-sigma B factor antagonist